ncbi:MAG: PhnD/SsuA/transferrin family substrate-binding protein [Pseudomonadota bacterium]
MFMRLILVASLLAAGSVLPVRAQVTGVVQPTAPAAVEDDESWRETLGRFRVGVVAGHRPALTARRLVSFRKAMADALDMPVELIFFSTEPAMIAAHRRGRIEYGVYTATGFAVLNGLCKCGEALAAPTTQSGEQGFRTVLTPAPGVKDLDQLRGQTVLMGADGDLARHWVVGYGLETAGLSPQALGWRMRPQPFATKALADLQHGKAKAAFLAEGPDSKTKPLWRSPTIRFGPHAVRRSLPAALKDRLAAWLVDLHDTSPQAHDAIEPVRGGGFQPATNADYTWLEKALRFHRILPISREAGVLSALRR